MSNQSHNNNKTFIKYLYENATATILTFVVGGFILSFFYNFMYFDIMKRSKYLTLFELGDYLESSIIFIFIIVSTSFIYAQLYHLNVDGILGRLKAARIHQKEISQEYETKNSIEYFFVTLLNVAITVIQILGVTAPYIVVTYILFWAYIRAILLPYVDNSIFKEPLIAIPCVLIVLDLIVAHRNDIQWVTRVAVKLGVILMALSMTMGIRSASIDYVSIYEKKDIVFVRSIMKGAFYLDAKTHKLLFLPWSEIKKIDN